jgi:hypothetical protein
MLSYEQVYGLSVLACVFYAWLMFIGRLVYNWWAGAGFRKTLAERLAGASSSRSLPAPYRLAIGVLTTLFLTAVSFVPVLNTAIAVVATLASVCLCVMSTLDLD